jgi:hypothetical protein
LCAVLFAALISVSSAAAVPPTLLSLAVQDRHPTATFSAPRAGSATIYFASKPDRATDGGFLQENITNLDILTDSEIQSGRWFFENQLDPGTYYAMIRASPDFDTCWISDIGGYDPACADGFSNVVPLTVPRPAIRYTARVFAYRYSRVALLQLTANPLGEDQPYRVCFRTSSKRVRCARGNLNGFSWSAPATDSLTVSTRGLPRVTTFTWYVAGKKVAARRARVH